MRRDRRRSFRVEWNSTAMIYDGTMARPCILTNFSNGGAKITGVVVSTVPDEFSLRITPRRRPHSCRVLWRAEEYPRRGISPIERHPSRRRRRRGASANRRPSGRRNNGLFTT